MIEIEAKKFMQAVHNHNHHRQIQYPTDYRLLNTDY